MHRIYLDAPQEGKAYTEANGPRHPAVTRGHRGTFFGMVPPEQVVADRELRLVALEREAWEQSAGTLECEAWELRQDRRVSCADRRASYASRASFVGQGTRVFFEDQQGRLTGHCDAEHILVAAGQACLNAAPSGLEGSEVCMRGEDLAEAFPSGLARHRVCVLGPGVQAAELCSFCSLGGAEVTWLPAASPGERPFGSSLDSESAGELMQQLQARGRMTVDGGFYAGAVYATETMPASPRKSDLSPRRHSEEKSSAKRVLKKEFFLRDAGGTDNRGPFDAVLLPPAARPAAVPASVAALPGVRTTPEGRLLVDADGLAAPNISALGACAAVQQAAPGALAAPGFEAFRPAAPDQSEALEAQARRFAAGLFGGAEPPAPQAPAVAASTLLSHPPAATVGLSLDEAREAYPPPVWHVELTTSRHEAPDLPGRAGVFAACLVCVRRSNGPGKSIVPESAAEAQVVGATLLSGGCGLQVLRGLALGISVAIRSGSSAEDFEEVLAAYPPTGAW